MLIRKINDKWFRFLGIPMVSIIGQWLFFESRFTRSGNHPVIWNYLISIVASVFLWEICRQIIFFSRVKYPNFSESSQRIFLQAILFFVSILLVRSIFTAAFYFSNLITHFDVLKLFFGVAITTLATIPFAAIYEAIFYYQSWKASNVEADELRKIILEGQLASLKAQINPHFLFNNLNTLSSIIAEDTEKAEEFLDKICLIYRYLLQKKQENLALLAEEIAFADAYFYILKTRFGNSIFFENKIPNFAYHYKIPTLTLQILFENVIKYNVISSTNPLKISILVEENKLVCSNSLQKKALSIINTQSGLNNIITKYRLLTKDDVEINENATNFEVKLPFIK